MNIVGQTSRRKSHVLSDVCFFSRERGSSLCSPLFVHHCVLRRYGNTLGATVGLRGIEIAHHDGRIAVAFQHHVTECRFAKFFHHVLEVHDGTTGRTPQEGPIGIHRITTRDQTRILIGCR